MSHLISIISRTLIVIGHMAVAFIGGMSTSTRMSLNVQIGSHEAVAAEEQKTAAIASALPVKASQLVAHPRPQNKPQVSK